VTRLRLRHGVFLTPSQFTTASPFREEVSGFWTTDVQSAKFLKARNTVAGKAELCRLGTTFRLHHPHDAIQVFTAARIRKSRGHQNPCKVLRSQTKEIDVISQGFGVAITHDFARFLWRPGTTASVLLPFMLKFVE
jgi:hypothetical protein